MSTGISAIILAVLKEIFQRQDVEKKKRAIISQAKRQAADRRERMGATFRAFAYACKNEVPPGNFYELSDEARETWKGQAEVNARIMGLVQP